MNIIFKMIEGFKLAKSAGGHLENRIAAGYFGSNAKPQKPKALIIACSDSRVDPAILFDLDIGDIFTVRNVANLIPPCESEAKNSYHGVSAAIEYAVKFLKVRHIIVFGHSNCGGIDTLLDCAIDDMECDFIGRWLKLSEHVRNEVLPRSDLTPEQRHHLAGKLSILNSTKNLRTYDFITERENRGELFIHGWYLDIRNLSISGMDNSGNFTILA